MVTVLFFFFLFSRRAARFGAVLFLERRLKSNASDGALSRSRLCGKVCRMKSSLKWVTLAAIVGVYVGILFLIPRIAKFIKESNSSIPAYVLLIGVLTTAVLNLRAWMKLPRGGIKFQNRVQLLFFLMCCSYLACSLIIFLVFSIIGESGFFICFSMFLVGLALLLVLEQVRALSQPDGRVRPKEHGGEHGA